MDAEQRPTWMLWMALGLVLAAFGGITLLIGSASQESGTQLRAIAKLAVGALIIAYALRLRRRAARY